jgi:hypothetical protein
MEGAVGVEVTIGDGPDRRRQTWIVAGEGQVVAHLEDPRTDAADAAGEADVADEPGDAGTDGDEDADADDDG